MRFKIVTETKQNGEKAFFIKVCRTASVEMYLRDNPCRFPIFPEKLSCGDERTGAMEIKTLAAAKHIIDEIRSHEVVEVTEQWYPAGGE